MAQTVKNLPAMQETWIRSLSWEDPLEKGMTTHSVFLPGESHGQRSLAGYSPWGRKESDTMERLTVSLSRGPLRTLNTYSSSWFWSPAFPQASFPLCFHHSLPLTLRSCVNLSPGAPPFLLQPSTSSASSLSTLFCNYCISLHRFHPF